VRVRFSFAGAGTEVRVAEKALAFDVASVFPDGRVEEAADVGADGLSQAAGGTHGPVMRVTSGEDGHHFVTQDGCSTYSSVPDLLVAVEFAVITDLLAQDDQTPSARRGRRDPERGGACVGPLWSGQVEHGVCVVFGRIPPPRR